MYPFKIYCNQLLSSQYLLREYLKVLDKRADCRYRFLIKEIRQAEGLSDDMKQISPMEWRAAMKAVTDKAEKIVKKEFVYILPKV